MKQHVLVGEVEVAAAVPFAPLLHLHLVRQVVVCPACRRTASRTSSHNPSNSSCWSRIASLLERVPFDEVADGHDELGLQQVHLLHGAGEDLLAVPAGAVGHDGELELIRVRVQLQAGERVFFASDSMTSPFASAFWTAAETRFARS